MVGGVLMGRHLPSQRLFLVAAVPALVSAIVMVGMHWVLKAKAKSEARVRSRSLLLNMMLFHFFVVLGADVL